jgi:hypothetical protein
MSAQREGQILYPRFEFFQQAAKVFEAGERSVPVYNDSHLFLQFREGEDDARHGAAVEVSDAGRIVTAGDLGDCRI